MHPVFISMNKIHFLFKPALILILDGPTSFLFPIASAIAFTTTTTTACNNINASITSIKYS